MVKGFYKFNFSLLSYICLAQLTLFNFSIIKEIKNYVHKNKRVIKQLHEK